MADGPLADGPAGCDGPVERDLVLVPERLAVPVIASRIAATGAARRELRVSPSQALPMANQSSGWMPTRS
jgi:hypothetical protein